MIRRVPVKEEKEDYKIEFLTSIPQLKNIRHFWEGVQFDPGADFEFFNLIVQVRKNIVSPCVVKLSRNELPIALLVGRVENAKMPIRLGYCSLAEIPIRQLVFIAGGFMGSRTASNLQLIFRSVRSFLSKKNVDVLLCERVKVNTPEHQVIRQLFKKRLGPRNVSKHWLLKLPGSWDDFLKGRKSKHRYWLRRLPRILDRDFKGEWNIKCYSSPSQTKEFIDAAEVVAQTTYQRRLGVGFQKNLEYVSRIELDANQGRLRGYVLYIKSEPKCFWYCFTYGRTLYLASTGYEPSFRSYELGTVLLMKVFKDHCGTDIRIVDFGEGDSDYKRRFGSECFDEESMMVFSNSTRSRLLYTVYHSTWFGENVAKYLFDRVGVLQRLKTYWRRRLVSK